MKNLRYLILQNYLCITIGLAISCYALYVEIRAATFPEYSALCDINSVISCTSVLKSEYSRGFGLVAPVLGNEHWANLPNPFYGILCYFLLLLLQFLETRLPNSNALTLTTISVFIGYLLNFMTIYLFFVLLHLRTICLICCSTYLLNFLFLVLSKRRSSCRMLIQSKKKK